MKSKPRHSQPHRAQSAEIAENAGSNQSTASRWINAGRWLIGTPWGRLVIIIALCAALAPSVLRGFHLRYYIDLDVYAAGGRAVLTGQSLYDDGFDVRGAHLPFTYPPLAAMLFAPLSLLPHSVAAVIMLAVSTAALWWCIHRIVDMLGLAEYLGGSKGWLSTGLLALALVTEPVRQTLMFGQINIVLMFLVLADVFGRRSLRGWGVGLAAAIKLTPAVFGLYFLITRQFKAAAMSVATGIAATLLAALVLPADSREYWTHTLGDPTRIGGIDYVGNQSLRGVVERALGPGEGHGLWVGASLVAFCVIAVTMWRHRGDMVVLLGLNSLVALLISPVSWSHHWVWLPVLLLPQLVRWTRGGVPGATPVAIATMLLTFIGPHWFVDGLDTTQWWAAICAADFVLIAVAYLVLAVRAPRPQVNP